MKIFTYKQSELPPLPPNLEETLANLDTQIAGLICENMGNYLALQKISEMLSDCTDTCELNLQQIEVLPDEQTAQPTLKDLSIEQKQLIYSCCYTNTLLLDFLSELTGSSVEEIVGALAVNSEFCSEPPTRATVERWIDELMKASKSDKTFFFKRM